MKNIFKKITAAAMAFTLLGTGSVIKTSTDNKCDCHNHTLTAEAWSTPTNICNGIWQRHNFQFNRFISPHVKEYECAVCKEKMTETTDHSYYRSGGYSEKRGSYLYVYSVYTCGICNKKLALIDKVIHV